MLRSSDSPDTDLISRRDMLKYGVTSLAAIACGTSQSRGDTIPDNPFNTHDKYPYLFSPLEFHTKLEEQHIPANNQAAKVVSVADEIAEKVKFLLHRHIRYECHIATDGPEHSLHIAAQQWQTIDSYMQMIAGEIVKEGFTYESSCSYHNGMVARKKHHSWPLDCDLASHIGLHIAKHHNMPIAGSESFCHMYLCSPNSHHIYEMTEMKNPVEFIQSQHTKKMKDSLTGSSADCLGYYRPMTERQLRQLIAGNILYEMRQKTNFSQDQANAHDTVCTTGEQMMREYGAGYYLVSNLITAHEEAAKKHTSSASAINGTIAAGYHNIQKEALKKRYAKILQAPFDQL